MHKQAQDLPPSTQYSYMSFDLPERKAEGEPGTFSHVIDATMHHINVSKVICEILAWKEGEPGNEARLLTSST